MPRVRKMCAMCFFTYNCEVLHWQAASWRIRNSLISALHVVKAFCVGISSASRLIFERGLMSILSLDLTALDAVVKYKKGFTCIWYASPVRWGEGVVYFQLELGFCWCMRRVLLVASFVLLCATVLRFNRFSILSESSAVKKYDMWFNVVVVSCV